MEILAKSSPTNPIRLAPGDSIELIHREHVTALGRTLWTNERKVLQHTTDKDLAIDECAVVEFSPSELKKQGWKDAIGGVFAERQ